MALAMMSLVLHGHCEHVDHGDCHGGNFLALVAVQAQFDPVLQDLLQTTARTAEVSERDYPNRKYPKSVNGVYEIIQHAISFTLFEHT